AAQHRRRREHRRVFSIASKLHDVRLGAPANQRAPRAHVEKARPLHALGRPRGRHEGLTGFEPAPEDRLVGAREISNVAQQPVEHFEIARRLFRLEHLPDVAAERHRAGGRHARAGRAGRARSQVCLEARHWRQACRALPATQPGTHANERRGGAGRRREHRHESRAQKMRVRCRHHDEWFDDAAAERGARYVCVMREAATAAPNPLSMFTTVTPAAQLFNIVSSGAMPANAAPYPTLVGTAITGDRTSPPTTDGSAPSMPAITITTEADASSSRLASTRWIPATPTSVTRATQSPSASSVTAGSSATGRSLVPAVTMATVPVPRGGAVAPCRCAVRAVRLSSISGISVRKCSAASSLRRVASTASPWAAIRRAISPICSAVLPAP